jgi:hypothetical protein
VRDLVITQNITLDGVIDASAGWFVPAGGDSDMSDVIAALAEQRAGATRSSSAAGRSSRCAATGRGRPTTRPG